MVKFLLVLYFSCEKLEETLSEEEFEAIADNHITKMVEMPAIPRVGEYIGMGNSLKVKDVVHKIKKRMVEVNCDVSLFEGVIAFIEDKEGWDMEWLKSGEKLFYQTVKQYEEVRAKS